MRMSFFRKYLSSKLGRKTGKVISNNLFQNDQVQYPFNVSRTWEKDLQDLKEKEHELSTPRDICSETQILTLSYPIFKVACADGDFNDEKSKLLTTILINCMSEIYKGCLKKKEQRKLAKLYIEDFMRINANKEKFEPVLLKNLSTFPKKIKNTIVDLMIKMAEKSGGVGNKEFKMIDYLTRNYMS